MGSRLMGFDAKAEVAAWAHVTGLVLTMKTLTGILVDSQSFFSRGLSTSHRPWVVNNFQTSTILACCSSLSAAKNTELGFHTCSGQQLSMPRRRHLGSSLKKPQDTPTLFSSRCLLVVWDGDTRSQQTVGQVLKARVRLRRYLSWATG